MAGKIEVRHLRLIQAVAREGSLTRAGARLHLSQSALSHQLLNLEKDLGAPLFDRVGKRMVPTEAGTRLLDVAETVLQTLADAEQAVLQRSQDERQRLRIAPSCPTMMPWLAAAAARFTAAFPQFDLQITPNVVRDVEALVADEVDLLLTERPSGDARFESQRLFSLETVALLPERHRLVTSRTPRRPLIGWRELAGETLLTPGLRSDDEDLLRAATTLPTGPKTRIWRVQLIEALAELVRAGHGIGIILEQIVPSALNAPGLVAMPLYPKEMRTVWAMWRKSQTHKLPFAELTAQIEALRQPVVEAPILTVVRR